MSGNEKNDRPSCPLNWLSAAEQAEGYGRGLFSPLDVLEASLARIEEVNPALNAFCLVDAEGARRAAAASAERWRAGRPLGGLDGVPVAIKDLTPTAGLRTAFGSRLFRDHVPSEDAVVVERLKAAGAVVVGKTTTSEFANASVTDSPLTGVTRNPWNPGRTSGGSSGGSAVAVATGCVALAEGSDMGGSVRIPASFCGVVGLKPALGRIPFGILPNLYDPLAHHGPIGRTTADAFAFLRATSGPDDRDPLSLPTDPDLALPMVKDPRGLRIGFSPDLGFQSVDDDDAENALSTARDLERRGAILTDVDLALTPALYDAGYKMFAVNIYECYGRFERDHAAELDPTLLQFFDLARSLSAAELAHTQIVVSEGWRKIARLYEACDALLCPTMPRTATPVGRTEFDYSGTDNRGRAIFFDMTLPFNLFGRLPAVSVPSGLGRDGLPTGLQIVAGRHRERLALSIATIVHDSAAWTERLRRLGPWTLPPSGGKFDG